jgi:DNA-binding SARP family transcriptional activator/WD40 repeat protein/tRNA A-37 threonylcarbamoyl transferase component Bud32
MVRVLVLGSIAAVRGDGGPLRLGSPLAQRLLAVLVTEAGRPIGRDRLIEVLWGDSPPDGATNNLQVYVSRLRGQLGHDTIETTSLGYALAPTIELDLGAFEHMLELARASDLSEALRVYDDALGLWRGPAFGAFAHEWWARPSAMRLEELRLTAMAERIDVLIALGDANRAVADSELLLAADPLKESSVRIRMRALHLSGRSAEALRVAAAFRRRLSEQAGLSPSPALDDFEQQILDHDPAAARSPVARSLRGYEFGELVAEGAHGAVYVAMQPSLGREVAIKVVRKDRADSPEFIRRFEAEAQFVARLEHPNIVPLYDYWREPGNAYLVMRLLRGGSLADRITRESIAITDIDLLIDRIGDALHSAHGRGVAHRDVRAANVLYDDEGRPYLADFGIALATSSDHDALDDVTALAAILQPLVGEDTALSGSRSLLRRAAVGEIASARELVMAWRASRELVTPTPTPDRPRRSRVVDAANPYVGLRVFDEADAASFFGRDSAIDEIIALGTQRPFVTVVGPSGAGKSSVVRAGVIPRLREQGCVVTVMTPGPRPLYSLGIALRRVATEEQLVAAGNDAARLLAEVATNQPTVLVVDQLEELWTQSVPEDRAQFVKVLDESTTRARLRIVSTIRADFYDRPLDEPILASYVQKGTYALTALGAAELEAAISGPLARTDVSAEVGLVAQIVADVSGRPAPLPLMQFALASLYDTRSGRALTLDTYRAIGGVGGAIASAADNLFQQLTPSQQEQCRELFASLVTPGESNMFDTRRRAPRVELGHLAPDLLDQLNGLRLLTFDWDAVTGEPTVEIAHEALLTHWPRLRQWTDDQRDQLRARKVLRDDAAAWQHETRNASYLYRAGRLDTALSLVGAMRLTEVERDFLDASVLLRDAEAAGERRRLRRTQTLLAATAGLLIVALVAGALAVLQKSRADRRADDAAAAKEAAQMARDDADVDRMIAQAQADATEEPVRAALLAVEAYRRRPNWETAGAIQSVLTQQTPGVLGYISDGGPFGLAKFGDRVIVAKDGATKLGVWDATTRQRRQSLEVGDIISIRLSPDERFVGASTPDKVVIVDVESGRQLAQLTFGPRPTVAGFDPNDPERLAVADTDGTVTVVRWRSGQTDWVASVSKVDAAIVSPDGRTLITSHEGGSSVRMWPMQALQQPVVPRLTIPTLNAGSTMELAFSPDGASVAAFDVLGAIRIWRVSDGTLTASMTTGPGASVTGGAFLDDATVVAQTAAGIAAFDLASQSRVTRIIPGVFFIALNPARTAVAVRAGVGASTGAIEVIALDGRQLGARRSLPLPRATAFLDSLEVRISVNSDASRLLVFALQPALYDLTSANPQPRLVEFPGMGELIEAQFTHNGGAIATVRSDRALGTATFQLWDPTTMSAIGKAIALPRSGIAYAFALSPDDRLFAWADIAPPFDKMVVHIYDVATGTLMRTLTDLLDIGDDRSFVATGSMSFNPDGTRLAAGTYDQGAFVWDLTSTPPVFTRLPTDAWTVSFSESGEFLMTTDFTSGSIRFYDGTTLAPRAEPIRGRATVRSIPHPTLPFALSDNTCGASSSGAVLTDALGLRPLALWDVERSRELGKGSVLDCGFWLPDGSAYGAKNANAIQIFDFSQQSWVATACQFAGRDLTAEEWERFGPDKPYRKTCADR